MEKEYNQKYYLANCNIYFIYRPDKYNGNEVAELFNEDGKSLKVITTNNWQNLNLSHHQVINRFEIIAEKCAE
jgi:hypothetical protein